MSEGYSQHEAICERISEEVFIILSSWLNYL